MTGNAEHFARIPPVAALALVEHCSCTCHVKVRAVGSAKRHHGGMTAWHGNALDQLPFRRYAANLTAMNQRTPVIAICIAGCAINPAFEKNSRRFDIDPVAISKS